MSPFSLLRRLFTPSRKKAEANQQDQIALFNQKAAEVKRVFEAAFDLYYQQSCQCAFPRFQQMVGIDCTTYGQSFKCFDTEVLMGMASKYFHETESELTDEASNKKWTCKTCGSTYEWGWSDFSISMERHKLKLTELKTASIGKAATTPIGIYFGLSGHSYPSREVIRPVSLEELERYMMERD